MTQVLKIAQWNANRLSQHIQEIKTFLKENKTDIVLTVEMDFTNKSYMKISKYNLYQINHPDGTAHAGTAVIIHNNTNHNEEGSYTKGHLQATTVAVKTVTGTIKVFAVCCPPKFKNIKQEYSDSFETLGNRFTAGGDYSANHKLWGFRLITMKCRELIPVMNSNYLMHIATRECIYWQSDPQKVPDAIDFPITKRVDLKKLKVQSNFDLSSDHSPVILTVTTEVAEIPRKPTLY